MTDSLLFHIMVTVVFIGFLGTAGYIWYRNIMWDRRFKAKKEAYKKAQEEAKKNAN